MSKRTITFSIREVTYYTGRAEIDAELFEEETGRTLAEVLESDDTDLLTEYVMAAGHVEEDGNVDSQDFTDFTFDD